MTKLQENESKDEAKADDMDCDAAEHTTEDDILKLWEKQLDPELDNEQFKKNLQALMRGRRKVKRLDEDLQKVAKGNVPNGYKPFKSGTGPMELDEEVGADKTLIIKLEATLTYREAKERIHGEVLAYNAVLDKEIQQKAIARLELATSYKDYIEACERTTMEFSKKDDELNLGAPARMFKANRNIAAELGAKLYRAAVKEVGKTILAEEGNLEKEKKEKEKLLDEVVNMDAKQLLAAATWQANKHAKELDTKFRRNIDYMSIVKTTTQPTAEEAGPCIMKEGKRMFTKKELAKRQENRGEAPRHHKWLSGEGLSPGGAPGHNKKGKGGGKDGKNGKSGKGVSAATNPKGKGKTQGKSKGKGKAKGQPMSATTQTKGKGGKGAGKGKSKKGAGNGQQPEGWRAW